jgi:hypothetical protein
MLSEKATCTENTCQPPGVLREEKESVVVAGCGPMEGFTRHGNKVRHGSPHNRTQKGHNNNNKNAVNFGKRKGTHTRMQGIQEERGKDSTKTRKKNR